MLPRDELAHLLRPAGGGLHLVSTGRAEQLAFQRRWYGAADEAAIEARFREAIARLPDARAVILGVPSDVGAGFRRGASLGPQAIREALLDLDPDAPRSLEARAVVDLGDVRVVPQLLHDEMLSEPQIQASRAALYPGVGAALPVSPLSIAERALSLVLAENPAVKPILLGGDHSCAWPAVVALAGARRDPWGIVQIDAHTDLLAERLGVRICFATWAFGARGLLRASDLLVQVGLRASRHDRAHWEGTLGVRQLWAAECNARPAETIDAIMEHLRARGARGVYLSNDIDGTDARFAPATGTPEPGGLGPAFVIALIERLGREIGLVGGDVMEVAPPLGPTPDDGARTAALGARYLLATLDAALG